jgi:hypothetical protein
MNKEQLTAKLLCITLEYSRLTFENAEQLTAWCKDQLTKRGFLDILFPANKIDIASLQLTLFCLGDKDNNFDKLIN